MRQITLPFHSFVQLSHVTGLCSLLLSMQTVDISPPFDYRIGNHDILGISISFIITFMNILIWMCHSMLFLITRSSSDHNTTLQVHSKVPTLMYVKDRHTYLIWPVQLGHPYACPNA